MTAPRDARIYQRNDHVYDHVSLSEAHVQEQRRRHSATHYRSVLLDFVRVTQEFELTSAPRDRRDDFDAALHALFALRDVLDDMIDDVAHGAVATPPNATAPPLPSSSSPSSSSSLTLRRRPSQRGFADTTSPLGTGTLPRKKRHASASPPSSSPTTATSLATLARSAPAFIAIPGGGGGATTSSRSPRLSRRK